jgi:predicted  nucleic acid-binding Zn-ribbon protein
MAVIENIESSLEQYAAGIGKFRREIDVEKMEVSSRVDRLENRVMSGNAADGDQSELERLRDREDFLRERYESLGDKQNDIRNRQDKLNDMKLDLRMMDELDQSWTDQLLNLKQAVQSETGEEEMPGSQMQTMFEGIDQMHSALSDQQYPDLEFDYYQDAGEETISESQAQSTEEYR